MTVAISTDVGMKIAGMEIGAGGRAGSGLGTRQSQAATLFSSSQGQSADRLSANHENPRPLAAGAESFRSRWQAMVNALETGPVAGQKTGPSARQGTAIGARQGTGIEAESADGQADESREMSGAVEVTLPKGAKSAAAAVTPNADAVPPWMHVTEQTGEPAAGTTAAMPARSQSGISARMAAAPEVQSVNPTLTSEVSGDERTGRSAKSDKRDSTLNAEQQGAANDNGTLATPIAVAAHPAAAASALQGQILPANFAGLPQSILADRVLSPDRGPDIAADRVTGSAATLSDGGRETAGMAARSQISPRAATGNPGTATPGGRGDGEAGGIHSLASPDVVAAAKQLTGSSRASGAQVEGAQLVPGASEHRSESGSPLAESAKIPAAANSGEYRGTNLEAEGNSAFDFRSTAANPVAEKPNQAGGGPSTAKVTVQTAHRDNAGDQIQPEMHVVLAQQGGAGVEASGMARVPPGAEGTSSAITAHAGASAGAQGGTATGGTFAAMDAGTEIGTPGWIHAGGQTAEAGFEDPALGWVGVRADLSGGNVHAALMTGSAEAAETLSGHLAGLNSYLAEQHTPVASLTMAAASGGGAGTGGGQSMQQGTGQNLGQDGGRNTGTESQSSLQAGTATIPAVAARATGNGGFDGVVPTGEMRGRHISVMA